MMNKIAIILAAGIGSRLAPLTNNYPKSLIKVNGREILDYQIQGYLSSGLKEEDIYIVSGYHHEMIVDFLQKNYNKVHVVYNPDFLITNNMYSLYLGLKAISNTFNSLDYLLINNADCLYDKNLMNEFINSKYDNAIASEIGTYIGESMKITTQENGCIINIAKTIPEEEAVGVSVDLYKYSKNTALKLFEIVKEFIEIKKDLKQWTEVAFPKLFETEKVYPFDIKNKKWVEVDNNDDLLLADQLFSGFDINSKKALICDMDGTLYLGKEPIQEAIDFVKTNKKFKYFFLTNNTSKTPKEYVDRLNRLGIMAHSDDIVTPLFILVDYLKERSYRSVYMIANQKVTQYMQEKLPEIKFEYDPKNNQALILTYDDEINYDKMKKACYLLNNKEIDYIATHHDVFCPTETGSIPDIGSFIKLFELTSQKTPNIILGKPSTGLVEKLLKQYGKDNLAVVGDRLYTDKALADNMKSDFICVLSGETTRLDVQNYLGSYPAIVLKVLTF